eukprot:5209231-Prymnesium_polylepis.1
MCYEDVDDDASMAERYEAGYDDGARHDGARYDDDDESCCDGHERAGGGYDRDGYYGARYDEEGDDHHDDHRPCLGERHHADRHGGMYAGPHHAGRDHPHRRGTARRDANDWGEQLDCSCDVDTRGAPPRRQPMQPQRGARPEPLNDTNPQSREPQRDRRAGPVGGRPPPPPQSSRGVCRSGSNRLAPSPHAAPPQAMLPPTPQTAYAYDAPPPPEPAIQPPPETAFRLAGR